MALEISIYNRQPKTSESGKTYVGYVCVFYPGQAGRLTGADQLPPFYIRDQRGGKQWIRLKARTIIDAKTEASGQAQDILQSEAKGLTVLEGQHLRDENRLSHQVAAYLAEIEANKSRASYAAYSRSLELFKISSRRTLLADVTRQDLLAFKAYLAKQKMAPRTIYNNFLNVMIFLAWTKHNVNVKKSDWPAKPQREPEEYHTEEIEALLSAANKNERLLLNAFLNSGLRDGEVAHLTYGDIDTRHSLWSVAPKNGHNLKTAESRRIVPVGEWLTKKIVEKKKLEGRKDEDLIFPNKLGKPDEHLIRVVQRVAKRVGVTGRVDNHKFRSTAITLWLRDGRTVPEVMSYVGHKNPSTILHYAAKMDLQKRENRERACQPFNKFAMMGD